MVAYLVQRIKRKKTSNSLSFFSFFSLFFSIEGRGVFSLISPGLLVI